MFHKLLLTVTIVVLVWLVYRVLKYRLRSRFPTGAGDKNDPGRPAENMVRCPVCGDFVVLGRNSSCGRSGCPGKM